MKNAHFTHCMQYISASACSLTSVNILCTALFTSAMHSRTLKHTVNYVINSLTTDIDTGCSFVVIIHLQLHIISNKSIHQKLTTTILIRSIWQQLNEHRGTLFYFPNKNADGSHSIVHEPSKLENRIRQQRTFSNASHHFTGVFGAQTM